MGATLAEALLAKATELVIFTQYDSVKDLEAAIDNREVYGAFVLPADFSSRVAILQTETPEKTKAHVINEGANATVVQLVHQFKNK